MTGAGNAGTAMIRQGKRTSRFPYRRVKGGYRKHGLGSLVTCRHLLSVSWRLPAISGLDTPVLGGEKKGSSVVREYGTMII